MPFVGARDVIELSVAVLLFIVRLLKVADFQPRIALVTRTLGRSKSDLLHFSVLFFSILTGYGIAGVLLFGHQYEGFSTISAAIVYLVVMLINWDPYQWISVNFNYSCFSLKMNPFLRFWLFQLFDPNS